MPRLHKKFANTAKKTTTDSAFYTTDSAFYTADSVGYVTDNDFYVTDSVSCSFFSTLENFEMKKKQENIATDSDFFSTLPRFAQPFITSLTEKSKRAKSAQTTASREANRGILARLAAQCI
ncbi:MAG: hypothetical protein IJT97_10465 [Bacteroidaceae bacterium]|nr:hypothetical protein [Bacteroidaceae bacterium]